MFNNDPKDPLNQITKAFAFAEGCIDKDENYRINTLPFKNNNPLDLKVCGSQFHSIGVRNGKLQFQDIGTGWNAGYFQVWLMANNKSKIYNNGMTFFEIAFLYSREGNSNKETEASKNWAKNALTFLGIDPVTEPLTTLQQVIDLLRPTEVILHPTPEDLKVENNKTLKGVTK